MAAEVAFHDIFFVRVYKNRLPIWEPIVLMCRLITRGSSGRSTPVSVACDHGT